MIEEHRLIRGIQDAYPSLDLAPWIAAERAVHLALMRQPYFDAILAGTKTTESRFARNRIAPIVGAGTSDIVIFKLVGQNRFALAIIDEIDAGPIDATAWTKIRARAEEIGIDETYIASKATAAYFALLSLRDVRPLNPLPLTKRDRRGWVILRPFRRQPSLL